MAERTLVRQENLTECLEKLKRIYFYLDWGRFEEKAADLLEQGEEDRVSDLLIFEALDGITEAAPDWTYVASRLFLRSFHNKAMRSRGSSFYELITDLTEEGIYDLILLSSYSSEEIDCLGKKLKPERDQLFSYIGIKTLADRYLAKTHDGRPAELPQERFMIIAMTLMSKEKKEQRISLVEEAYWALSNLYMTVATPTLANAGKSYGQLSSCFIDMVDDNLRGIYDSNTDVATLSKNGGGLGVYLGKIRAHGSSIKGFKGRSSGIIPWMRQLNNTAVSVDQLGQRQGAIAVYLPVFHKDIFSFLDAKLNNGDERLRTHDLFTGVVIPDLFMKKVSERGEWHLFDPQEVREKMGFDLDDYYDEESPGEAAFTIRYEACSANMDLSRTTVPAIEIMKQIMISQLETGTPYMFYRDAVNRANPNKHMKGEGRTSVYCSNLCTEITQNMSPTTVIEERVSDGRILIEKTSGDFVVCNLSSINLGRAVPANVLARLIPIQVRLLDNVIDHNENRIGVPQAVVTNKKYRAIGLGTFGWHHLLALKKISWESEQAVRYADELYEEISFLTIRASMKLAEEKGVYPVFKGSDWETGRYFERRNYKGIKWENLKRDVAATGLRNGYLMAVAPNSSTSLIGGGTASIDPIFQRFYSEEKKDYKIPVTAPDLSPETFWYYKSAYVIDQKWSIRQNAARQRHIDQAISFNLYVTNDIKAKELLSLHLTAWQAGLKTTYYTRSTSAGNEGCEACES